MIPTPTPTLTPSPTPVICSHSGGCDSEKMIQQLWSRACLRYRLRLRLLLRLRLWLRLQFYIPVCTHYFKLYFWKHAVRIMAPTTNHIRVRNIGIRICGRQFHFPLSQVFANKKFRMKFATNRAKFSRRTDLQDLKNLKLCTSTC